MNLGIVSGFLEGYFFLFKGCCGWEENSNTGKGKVLIFVTGKNNVLTPMPLLHYEVFLKLPEIFFFVTGIVVYRPNISSTSSWLRYWAL
jgi:hypothetical protein